MPQDVITTIHRDDLAEVEFLTPEAKRAGLAALHAAADDAREISVDTGGTRRTYKMHPDLAKAAGLHDGSEVSDETPAQARARKAREARAAKAAATEGGGE